MKKYKITYSLLINNNRRYFIYYVYGLCKLHALIKFKLKNKHKKVFKREILQIKNCKGLKYES